MRLFLRQSCRAILGVLAFCWLWLPSAEAGDKIQFSWSSQKGLTTPEVPQPEPADVISLSHSSLAPLVNMTYTPPETANENSADAYRAQQRSSPGARNRSALRQVFPSGRS